jgi:hypothetical protein
LIDPALTYRASRRTCYENLGKAPWFKLLGPLAGSYFGERHVGAAWRRRHRQRRRPRLLFTNNNERAYLLENKGAASEPGSV